MSDNTTLKTRIINKHDIEANWITASNVSNPFIPRKGEFIIYDPEIDVQGNVLKLPEGRTIPFTYARVKLGDGINKPSDLPFITDNIEITESQIIDLKNYKVSQEAIAAVETGANEFIDTIAQDENGNITITTKSVDFSGSTEALKNTFKQLQEVIAANTSVKNRFVDTIAQDEQGVITVTFKDVDFSDYRSAADQDAIDATFKTKQNTYTAEGSNTKTITKVTQNANGEVEVTFGDIDFSHNHDSEYKKLQEAIAAVSTDANVFAYGVAQNINGEIEVKTKAVDFSAYRTAKDQDTIDATFKTKQEAYSETGSDKKTITSVTQTTNGDVEVLYSDIKEGSIVEGDEGFVTGDIAYEAIEAAKAYAKDLIDNLPEPIDYSVTCADEDVEASESAPAFKRHILTQNGKTVCTIDVPRDLVVKSGRVDKETDELVLVLVNDEEIRVDVSHLIEYVTGDTAEDGVITVNVSDDFVATATINDGTITSTKFANEVDTYVDNRADDRIAQAINALDVTDITGFGAGKTLATLTETDGKIAATFQDIAITESQITDLKDYVTNTVYQEHLTTQAEVDKAQDDRLDVLETKTQNIECESSHRTEMVAHDNAEGNVSASVSVSASGSHGGDVIITAEESVQITADIFKFNYVDVATADTVATAKQEAINTIVGTDSDVATSNTVKGAKAYADARKAEVVEMIEAVAFAGLTRSIVTELPDASTAALNTVYMVKRSAGLDDKDIYDEYIVVEVEGVKHFELLGNTELDLTGYATEQYVDDKVEDLTDKVEKIEEKLDDICWNYVLDYTDPRFGYDEFDGVLRPNRSVFEGLSGNVYIDLGDVYTIWSDNEYADCSNIDYLFIKNCKATFYLNHGHKLEGGKGIHAENFTEVINSEGYFINCSNLTNCSGAFENCVGMNYCTVSKYLDHSGHVTCGLYNCQYITNAVIETSGCSSGYGVIDHCSFLNNIDVRGEYMLLDGYVVDSCNYASNIKISDGIHPDAEQINPSGFYFNCTNIDPDTCDNYIPDTSSLDFDVTEIVFKNKAIND